jgi:hypothetical protein
MAIRIVRFGRPKQRGEGVRLGTVRRPPRGVRKDNYAREHWFDVWLPNLAPSASGSVRTRSPGSQSLAAVRLALSRRDGKTGSQPSARRAGCALARRGFFVGLLL